MYEPYYGLRERPFSILPDPAFLYWGRSHSLAFAMLEYGLINQAGFTVITGEVGSGKTTLVRHLLDSHSDELTVGLVSNTNNNPRELLQWILLSFDQDFTTGSAVRNYALLRQFLDRHHEEGTRCALIIDEAQNLGMESLEQLRMLSNVNYNKDQVLQVVLVGQPELKGLLQRPEMRQFAQRVSSDFHLRRLNLPETGGYIRHRLSVAGQEEPLFSAEAVELVYKVSQGIPRVINILCDTALVYGFSSRVPRISLELVEEVVADRREHGILEFGPTPNIRAVDMSEAG